MYSKWALPRVRNLLVAIALWWHSDDPSHRIDSVWMVINQDVHLSNKWSASDFKDVIRCKLPQIPHDMLYASQLSTSCRMQYTTETAWEICNRILFFSCIARISSFVLLIALSLYKPYIAGFRAADTVLSPFMIFHDVNHFLCKKSGGFH